MHAEPIVVVMTDAEQCVETMHSRGSKQAGEPMTQTPGESEVTHPECRTMREVTIMNALANNG